jgi:mRNA interferase MazF
MQEGDIAIAFIQQSDGAYKPRPVLLLRQMPGYGDFLVCGIFTQLRQEVPGFDEVLTPDADNQLRAPSVVRLANLIALPTADIDRAIGFIPATLHAALLQRLATYLRGPT